MTNLQMERLEEWAEQEGISAHSLQQLIDLLNTDDAFINPGEDD